MPPPGKGKSKPKGKNKVTKEMVNSGTVTAGSTPRLRPDHPANVIPTELLNQVGKGTNHRILRKPDGSICVVNPQGQIIYEDTASPGRIEPKRDHPNKMYEEKVMMPAAGAGLIRGAGMGRGIIPGEGNPGPPRISPRRVKGTPESAQSGNTIKNTDYTPQKDGSYAPGRLTDDPSQWHWRYRNRQHEAWVRAEGYTTYGPRGGKYESPKAGLPDRRF